MNIDLSKPVYCGGELIQEKLYRGGYILLLLTKGAKKVWTLNGTPLGDWAPLTNEPPTPEVDERGEEVKALLTRISELKGILSLVADKAYYEDSDFGRYVYNLIKYI